MGTCGWQSAVALVALVAGTTCGSSQELGDTGLPDELALASMTPDEWEVFCKAFDAARRKNPEEECRRLAFAETRIAAEGGTDAEVRATCQARYDTCTRDIRPPTRMSGVCPYGPLGPDCMATVGEAEQCLMAGVARRKEDASKIPSCSVVTADQARATAGTIGSSEAEILMMPVCQTFEAKCPGLLQR
jgi:hypothetical protein